LAGARRQAARDERALARVAVELLGVVADVIPGGFLGHEFMEPVPHTGVFIQRMGGDGKALVLRQDFTQRRATGLAETTGVFVGRRGFIARNVVLPGNPSEVCLLDEDHDIGADLAAARAMTGAHH